MLIKIPYARNAIEYYQSVLKNKNPKLVDQSKIITEQRQSL